MSTAPAEIKISAGSPDRAYWADLWRYRELLGFLAWRDIKVRYKQATLGVAWALLQPLVTMIVFTLVFGQLAKMDAGGVPYSLLVLAGLLPWQLFSAAFSGASGSLLNNASLVSKVYFPRLIIPMSSLAVALIDFAIACALYVALVAWFLLRPPGDADPSNFLPTWRILFLPGFVVLALGVAFGTGAWLTALTVRYRDFRFITPFLLQVGVFLSPVGFRTDITPNWHSVLALNPMTGIIGGFRWCLLGEGPRLDPVATYTCAGVTVLLVASGIWHFRRTERSLADEI